MRVGPTALRGRRPITTYLYEDPTQPDRITATVGEPWFTTDDRSLLLGLQLHEDTLCPGCGQPKEVAWHHDVKDKWKGDRFVCHACTALKGEQTVFNRLAAVPTPAEVGALSAFDIEKSTTEPFETPPTR